MQPEQDPDRDPHGRPPLVPVPEVPGWRIEVLEASPSTNADVTRRALAGEPAGLVLVAEHQTAGRGRLDRRWLTPPRAALTFSLLVDPVAVPAARWPWLPLLTGLAVLDGVRAQFGGSPVDVSLKWPNDVLVDGLKVAGILVERVERVERRAPGPAGPVAVVGVGINVTSTRAELPVPTATSLALASARTDRAALLDATLRAFSIRYAAWCAAAGLGLQASYAAECSTVGRRVRVHLPQGGTLTGVTTGVDHVGRLMVDDGWRTHVLGAGDVVHVRPAGEGQ